MFRSIVNQLCHAFTRCYLCQLSVNDNQLICHCCQSYFEKNKQACRRCATPIPSPTDTLCGQCQQTKSFIDNTCAPWRYQPPLSGLICDFKYHSRLFLSSFLAQCMLKNNPTLFAEADYLIPMPIHPKRLKNRGFNQTTVLAKLLSKETNIPVHQSLCHRISFIGPQAQLKQQARHRNTQNAFYAKPVKDLHLIIIDDIITTGATANSLAKELKQKGAKKIDLWCIAKN